MPIPGTRLGPYEIKALIGQGGMGEVYRARDTKLDRDVAIKILPAGFATDPERLARFEREAKALASLNHPNIAHVYGTEDAGLTRALVMELVEGEDLSERLARSPLALADALAIARQIAEGMQNAHDHGIIHRDLKPANIKVKVDGTVKILDFGLAKMVEASPVGSLLSHAPTMMSMPGSLLGTAAYMSPEQIKGQTADARSDVWAFGCILFEMLTRRTLFAATTTSEILASVLTTEPDWRQLPPDTPEPVRRLLRRCLQKNQTNRLRAMADARLDIDEAQQLDGSAAHSPAMPRSRIERLAWASIVALLGVAVLALGVWPRRRVPAPAEVRFDSRSIPRRTTDSVRRRLGRPGSCLVTRNRLCRGAPAGRDRRCGLSVLVSGWPFGCVLCGWVSQAARSRWWVGPHIGKSNGGSRRDLEP
ncbi:MAG: hypothetical protein DMG14_35185 [Acidobacteria bacterium]|nr:MAG: hypothetical protein DMG14_35185 [Acidobacteriota bacterium]